MARSQDQEWAGGAAYWDTGKEAYAHPRSARTIRCNEPDGDVLVLADAVHARHGEPFTISNESASTELVVKDYDGADIITIDPDTVVQLAPGRNGEWVVTRVAARIYP